MKAQLLSLAAMVFYHGAHARESDVMSQIRSESLDARDLDGAKSSSAISVRRSAFAPPQTSPVGGQCPQVWYDIAADLRPEFVGCSRRTADAIRFAFHDGAGYSSKNKPYAPASGGADGSLLLSDSESARSINDPLQGYREFLLGKYNNWKDKGVGAADFVQAAGSIGIVSCPGGPVVKTVIGRNDTSTAAPEGTLPVPFGMGSDYQSLIQLWADKGFSPRELAALMGAHSVSRAFAQQQNGIPSGGQQDSTPRQWDLKYYEQTQAAKPPRGVFRFQSDVNLANPATDSGKAFTEFSQDRAAWATAFQSAMFKLGILGLSEDKVESLQDCTDIVTQGNSRVK